jgi:hypothetical protein
MHTRLFGRATIPLLLTAFGFVGVRGALAAQGPLTIPADTVVRVKLDDRVNSKDARVGDRVMASISPDDRSGFPLDTRFEGTVTEVDRYDKDKPGMVNMEFRNALLPDGRRVAVEGRLNSLSEEDVRRTSDGRMEAKRKNGSKPDWKWAGYGAAGGAVLGAVLGGGTGGLLKGAILGGLGGAAYTFLNGKKNKGDFRDVDLPKGTEFGLRLDQRVAFDSRDDYRFSRRTGLDDGRDSGIGGDRVAGERQERRYDSAVVRVNGRNVQFTDARPINLNGVLYVPLRPVADAANLRFSQRAGDEGFTLQTPNGLAQGYAGDQKVTLGNQNRDEDSVLLNDEPVSINGVIYVSSEYLGRVADMRANWDRRTLRLELETS